jgi:cellulose synthase/poly-beta-1,6-N-acetylglucosamine synthase-like glycosyltransferase
VLSQCHAVNLLRPIGIYLKFSTKGNAPMIEKTIEMEITQIVEQGAGELTLSRTSTKKIGDILLERGYITNGQLAKALIYQREHGGRLGWILTTMGYISRLQLYQTLAQYFKLPFITNLDYIKKKSDKKLAAHISPEEAMRYQMIPVRAIGKTIWVITTEPDNPEALEFLGSRFWEYNHIEQIIMTDTDFAKLSQSLYGDKLSDAAINGLFYRNPEQSARKVISTPQIIFLCILLAVSAIWICLNAGTFFIFVLALAQVFYLVSISFKFIATLCGISRPNQKQAGALSANNLDPKHLPVYTVLIAAYKEAKVIGTLIKAIKRLDYPENKLDVILLLEEDDEETLEAAKRERPPASWRFLVLPNSQPKTKPKALNYGLHFARGEYLTIYDAEDIPEPDQLKKAVAAFKSHPDNYICFQAALNYFNSNDNFLTKMFTLEYSYWFDCLLPGLDALKLPIPLGGTSNHFDVKKLKRIGGWDPFNVTEDADLGIRASAEGYKVGVIDSTTYEEANSKLGNWLKQRSRWVKGYMQTFLVHNRKPLKAVKEMGLKQWLGYNLLIGGTPAMFLLNPIMWALFTYYLLSGAPILDPTATPALLLYISAINLFIGNALAIWINMAGIVPRKHYRLLLYALLNPVYWVLQSAGAYKALWQLIVKPSYWEKTTHGITAVTLL